MPYFNITDKNNSNTLCIIDYIHFAIFSKYLDTYRIATQVSRYVSYRGGTVSLRPYQRPTGCCSASIYLTLAYNGCKAVHRTRPEVTKWERIMGRRCDRQWELENTELFQKPDEGKEIILSISKFRLRMF